MHALGHRDRLFALAQTGLMDSGAEEAFDRFTRLASQLLGAPVALISLLDDRRQYFKSAVGVERQHTPLSHSFCRYVVETGAPLVIGDTREDERRRDNPAVTDLNVIAYCGVPLIGKDGHPLGSLCVISDEPRAWSQRDVAMLGELATGVMTVIELRVAHRALAGSEERLRVTVDRAPIGVAVVDLDPLGRGAMASANDTLAEMLGDPEPVLSGLTLCSIVHPEDVDIVRGGLMALACDGLARIELQVRCLHGDGHYAWLLLAGAVIPSAEADEPPRQAVFHVMDIGERKRFEGQLQHLADHDALTGLFNRGRFESELERVVAHSERYGSCGGVLLIDLDGFKYVNDTMGHSCGDELVTRIGGLLRASLRETDVVARIGGDEFAVIVNEVDEAGAMLVAEKLLGVMREGGIVVSEDRSAKVTASIGITTYDATSSLTPEELMVEADIAMYEAKESGKNCAAAYRREEQDRGSSRVAKRESWLERLRQASANEGFELLAQPIVGICAQDVPHFELLLRLRSEDGDLIPPGTFLYNAERFNLVQGIDRWVFGRALELLKAHQEAGNDISLSVNMSGKTLNDPELLDDLSQMIAGCPVPRDRLVVEVTETAAITNIEKAGRMARSLRELGVQFALDDFGAGFASFYYLKHLDFDYLKIDGEFVRSLARNVTDQLVIKSVVDIARGLGAKTIAEFVGDDDAVARLRELGVDFGQGYHLGRPGPLSERLPALPPAQLAAAERTSSSSD